MAATITKYPNLHVGDYESQEFTVVITTPASGTSEAIAIPEMQVITAIKSFIALDSGNNIVTSDADLTFSGNVVTIADGSTFDYSGTTSITLTVLGIRRV